MWCSRLLLELDERVSDTTHGDDPSRLMRRRDDLDASEFCEVLNYYRNLRTPSPLRPSSLCCKSVRRPAGSRRCHTPVPIRGSRVRPAARSDVVSGLVTDRFVQDRRLRDALELERPELDETEPARSDVRENVLPDEDLVRRRLELRSGPRCSPFGRSSHPPRRSSVRRSRPRGRVADPSDEPDPLSPGRPSPRCADPRSGSARHRRASSRRDRRDARRPRSPTRRV